MIKPIRILVGEVLGIKYLIGGDDKVNDFIVIRHRRVSPQITLLSLKEWRIINLSYNSLKSGNPIRKGYLGPKINRVDDHLCHVCFPSKIAGCSDCIYRGLTRKRKQYFCPGDHVFDPILKSEYIVDSVILGFKYSWKDRNKVETLDLLNDYNINLFRSTILKTPKDIKSIEYEHLFKLEGELTRLTYYTHKDIRLIKRYYYLADLEQLNHICSNLCIYEMGSEYCKKCETNLVRNDIQGYSL